MRVSTIAGLAGCRAGGSRCSSSASNNNNRSATGVGSLHHQRPAAIRGVQQVVRYRNTNNNQAASAPAQVRLAAVHVRSARSRRWSVLAGDMSTHPGPACQSLSVCLSVAQPPPPPTAPQQQQEQGPAPSQPQQPAAAQAGPDVLALDEDVRIIGLGQRGISAASRLMGECAGTQQRHTRCCQRLHRQVPPPLTPRPCSASASALRCATQSTPACRAQAAGCWTPTPRYDNSCCGWAELCRPCSTAVC
jgi:hypothetical protein